MSDLKYIIKCSVIGIITVTLGFMIDFSSYYQVDYVLALRRVLYGDIYTLSYYGILILLIIVLFEIWKIFMDVYEDKYRILIISVLFIIYIGLRYVSVYPLFVTIGRIFIFILLAKTIYHQYLQYKPKRNLSND